MKIDFKKLLPHIAAIVVILVMNLAYFLPQFQGKKLMMGDIVSGNATAHEAREFRKNTGEEALWTNSLFGGMPTYNISSKHRNNISQTAESVLNLGMPKPAGAFILGMLSLYLCLVLLGVGPWASLSMAIVFGLSTSNLMLYGAGHVSKVRAIMASPPIIVGVLLIIKKRYWIGALLFTLFMSISVTANHPQMTYYLGITLALYMIFALVDAIQKGEMADYGKSVALLALCSVIALGGSAAKLLPSYEYGKETMRGKPILQAEANGPKTSSQVDGLDFEYAMNWSGGSLDLISTFIPYAAGGGTVEYLPKDSKYAKVTRQNRKVQAYTYFGSLPSTAGPYYFGAIVFFLFILGAIVIKGKFKWWLISGFGLTLLMAMGKNFAALNHTLFDYLPLFNKFRTPNSVLSISGILLIILAGLGFAELVNRKNKESLVKPLLIAAGSVAGFSILFGLIGPSMISFESSYDNRLGGNQAVIDALYSDRASMLRSSAMRTAFFVLAAAGLIWLYLKGKANKYVMISLVGLLAVADQVLITKNYFGDNWVSKRQYQQQTIVPSPANTQILADTDPHFRVQDLSTDTYNDAKPSFFHKMIGGYHPAKLQRIQDVIERHLTRSNQNPYGNQAVLNMLNTKYFIVPTAENTSRAQQNPAAAGNAWFVEDVRYVDSANEEIDALTGLEPLRTAIIHDEFKSYMGGLDPSKAGSIKLTEYSPIELTYSSNSNSEQLAVFSEVWYGPDLGWQAYIDDQPVDHIRANYLLRAMKVPAGQHTIKFKFDPQSYKTGGTISLISSILLLLIAAFAGYKIWQGNESVYTFTDNQEV